MTNLKDWPPVLLRRWLLQIAAGAGCLTVGFIMFLAMRDTILLMISATLFVCFCLQWIAFHHMVSKAEYEIAEGVCIDVKHGPLPKQRILCLRSDNGRESAFPLEKQTPAETGVRYRIYFRRNACPSEHPLAVEPLTHDQPAQKK